VNFDKRSVRRKNHIISRCGGKTMRLIGIAQKKEINEKQIITL
jgi:hypothetical protein